MRRVSKITIALALIVFARAALFSYRVHAASEAVQFAPANIHGKLLPEGTVVHATMVYGILRSAQPHDPVIALLPGPTFLDGNLVLAPGAELKGNLQKLLVSGARGEARITFTVLLIDRRAVAIETEPVIVRTPVQTDVEALADALKILLGASVGASIGAASGDPSLTRRGLFEGAQMSTPTVTAIPIAVTLARDLRL